MALASCDSSCLVVAHCYREGESVVRLISARKATRTERAQYDAQGNA